MAMRRDPVDASLGSARSDCGRTDRVCGDAVRTVNVSPVDAIGWTASAVLITTLLHPVRVQWRERSTEGVSGWLFSGQLASRC